MDCLNPVVVKESIRKEIDLSDTVIDNTKSQVRLDDEIDKPLVRTLSDYHVEYMEKGRIALTSDILFEGRYELGLVNRIKMIAQAIVLETFAKSNDFDFSDLAGDYNVETEQLKIDDFVFEKGKACIFLSGKADIEKPLVLLLDRKESICKKAHVEDGKLLFDIGGRLKQKKYEIFVLDKEKVYTLKCEDPNVISVEPFDFDKSSMYTMSYENNGLCIAKKDIKSDIRIKDADVEKDSITLKIRAQKDVSHCRVYLKGRRTKEMLKVPADLNLNGEIECVIASKELPQEKFSDVYVYTKTRDWEKIEVLSAKESYFEKRGTSDSSEFAVTTTKGATIAIERINQGRWITRRRNVIRGKLMKLIQKKTTANKNIAIFESYAGRQYSCHPRAIYEYIRQQRPDIKCIWSVDKGCEKIFKENNITMVRRFSFKWIWLMSTSKYWVSNARLPLWVRKPRETVYLQTWHGTPLKRLGTDIDEIFMPGTDTFNYNRNFYRESRNWDYLISPNRFSTNVFSRAFAIDKEKIIESGSPRNDFLIKNKGNGQLIDNIKKSHGIPLDKKVVIYAPTWRDDQFFAKAKYKFSTALDLEKLKRELSDEYVLILRMHYLVADDIDLTGYEDFAYNISTGDITQLYLISDILVTDYSSVYFDYAVLKRPMVFFMYDIDDYRDRLRGFYLDVDDFVPGPIVKTNEELAREIKMASSENKDLKRFLKQFCELEDGEAAKRVCEKVFKT